MPPADAAYGRCAPSSVWQRLIHVAQGCPHNWFGQQVAQVIRHLVLRLIDLPVDLSVESVRMRCHMVDNCSEKKFAFMPWRFDGRERQIMVESLPADGVFVDIGANVGIYTLTAAAHLGPSGRVIALEPNPPTLARLRFNLEATRAGRTTWPTVDTLALGVADRACTVDLYLDADNLGASTIVAASGEIASSATVRIECRPLLEILKQQAVSHIDVLKIDIDGAEDIALMPFLAAAPASQLPRVLIIENSEQRWKHDLPDALRRSGYTAILRSRMNSVYVR